MADYRILLEADTAKAERDLRRVDTVADTAARNRKIQLQIPDLNQVQRGFTSLRDGIEGAANNIRQFYGVSKLIPGIGDKVQNVEDAFNGTANAVNRSLDSINRGVGAGDLLQRAFSKAASGADFLISNLAKIGFALYGLEKIVGVLQSAFGKLFAETIGREIALRETLLKTQTTVASMSDVFVDGKKITDPLQKIKALTKSVEKNVDSIRERSLELAGVTSNDVVEVFGIVAGQIGQIGGGLKDAEDLAISFSAALGTFGIPLQQARQEITSMLQGNIGADSYLARALGITNSDIAKARTQTGGIIKFIQDKLETAVAGQKLAAQSFSGVTSNIRELGEIIGQRFGRGLLDPLLAGLTAVYNALSRVKDTLYELADTAGRTIGAVLRIAAVNLSAGILGNVDVNAALSKAAGQAKAVANTVFAEIGRIANNTIQALIRVVNAIKPAILATVDAFRVLLKAFAELKVGQFQAVVSALANIISAISPAINIIAGLVNAWAKFLDLPIVQYISEVAVVLGLLKRMGLDAALGIAAFANFLLSAGVPAIARIGVAIGGFIVTLGLLIAAVGNVAVSIAALAGAFLTPAAAIPALQAGLLQFIASLRAAGAASAQTGAQLTALGAGFQAAGAGAKAMALSMLSSLGKFALIQIAIAVAVDLFGRFQRAQQDAAEQRQFETSLAYLEKNAKAAAAGLDAATQATYDYHKAQAQQQINKNVEAIQKLDEELKRQEELLGLGKTGWDKFVHTLMYGANVQYFAGEKAVELAQKKKQLRAEIERVIAALKAEAAAEAEAYANSPKGRLEQKMKEAKAAAELLKTNQQIALNSIAQSQLSGAISEQESKRLEIVQQINGVAKELAAKRTLLNDLIRIDPSNTEEINKLKGEIVTLEGKQINLQINLNKANFDAFVQNLERTTTIRTAALSFESALLQTNLNLVQSQAQAEQGRLNYVLQGLNYAKENATTDSARIGLAQQIATVQKQIADSQYRAAIAAIETGIRQSEIELQKVKIKEAELRTIVATAKAQKLITDAHYDALRAASESVRLAENSLRATTQSARYQREAAEWTRQGAHFAANAAVQAERKANAERSAAKAAEDYADAQGRASRGSSYSRPALEPWQEEIIREAKNKAAKNAGTAAGGMASYVAAINADMKLYELFTKPAREAAKAEQEKAKAAWIAQYGRIPGFATGGIVTKPTLALIGEGGEREFVIPESKMASTASRYLAGSTDYAAPSTDAPTINIKTGPVLEFDGQRYVTVNDFERGLRRTAETVLGNLRTPAGRYAMGVR